MIDIFHYAECLCLCWVGGGGILLLSNRDSLPRIASDHNPVVLKSGRSPTLNLKHGG